MLTHSRGLVINTYIQLTLGEKERAKLFTLLEDDTLGDWRSRIGDVSTTCHRHSTHWGSGHVEHHFYVLKLAAHAKLSGGVG